MQPGAELQTLFLAAKVRTKQRPPNKIKKKVESNHKKVEEQAKKQQERAKNRSETNKSPDSERTKTPTQTPERSKSELRTQSKKEGCENPSKNIRVVL